MTLFCGFCGQVSRIKKITVPLRSQSNLPVIAGEKQW